MRCTRCSAPVKPIVAVDIDGTLGKYHGHFYKFAEQYLQTHLPWPYMGAGRIRDFWGMGVEEYRRMKLAYRQGGMKRSMPAFEGATELCNSVQEMGGELWITTTRPFLRLDNIDPDTRFWLNNLGIYPDGMLYEDSKYTKLAELVDKARVVAVVDDLGELIHQAQEAFDPGITIQHRTIYNQDDRVGPGSLGLTDIAVEITRRIGEWYDQEIGHTTEGSSGGFAATYGR